MPASDHTDPDIAANVKTPKYGAWLTTLRAPGIIRRMTPSFVVLGLHAIFGRIATRNLPRRRRFLQSVDDAKASSSMSVVVAIHDAPKVTRRCLTSLEHFAPQSEVILVDDGSKLSETTEIISDFGHRMGWKIVRHEKPAGHSAACRDGAAVSTRPNLCLLNSDTVVTPWCWALINRALESDPKIGVLGPSTSNSSNPQSLPTAHELGRYWNDSQICAYAESLRATAKEPNIVDLPWISGFALFVRKNVWDELGGFDPKLPDYGNEKELCTRVASGGYRLVWVRDAYIHHFAKQSYKPSIGEEEIRARVRAAEAYIGRKNDAAVQ